MANSDEITALDSGIVTKTNYRGNVQAIPFTLTNVGNDSHVISKKLPEEARVISAVLAYDALGSGATADMGYAGSTNAIIDGVANADEGINTFPAGITNEATGVFTTAGSIDVGGKILLVTVASADASDKELSGHVLIATNE